MVALPSNDAGSRGSFPGETGLTKPVESLVNAYRLTGPADYRRPLEAGPGFAAVRGKKPCSAAAKGA